MISKPRTVKLPVSISLSLSSKTDQSHFATTSIVLSLSGPIAELLFRAMIANATTTLPMTQRSLFHLCA
jgi:hypothetical protein